MPSRDERILQLSSLLTQTGAAFSAPGSPTNRLATGLTGSAQSGIIAEQRRQLKKKAQKKKRRGTLESFLGAGVQAIGRKGAFSEDEDVQAQAIQTIGQTLSFATGAGAFGATAQSAGFASGATGGFGGSGQGAGQPSTVGGNAFGGNMFGSQIRSGGFNPQTGRQQFFFGG